MKHTQNTRIVAEQFKNQLALYTHHSSGATSQVVMYLTKYIKNNLKNKKEISILEFGGGNGALLYELKKKLSSKSVTVVNAELVEDYVAYQVHKSIQFVVANILESQFKNNSFDFVIIRNVMHHLVGKSISETRQNLMLALSEMTRIVKEDGLVLIEEQTNQSTLANNIIFWASFFATKLKINIPRLQITPHTIVGYMTETLLKKYVAINKAVTIISSNYQKWNQPWWLKYPLLLFNNGSSLIVIKKNTK